MLAFCHFDSSLLHYLCITAFEIFKSSILIWGEKAPVLQESCRNIPLVVSVKGTRNLHCRRGPFPWSQPVSGSPYNVCLGSDTIALTVVDLAFVAF